MIFRPVPRRGPAKLIVHLDNRQKSRMFSRGQAVRTGKAILKALRWRSAEVTYIFVDDRQMAAFNRRYKGNRGTTDVLAFSQIEGKKFPGRGPVSLGDVVISVSTARRQAPLYGNSFHRELLLYMIHGTLHLMGYDDLRPGPRRRMRRKENEIMKKLLSQSPAFR